MTKHLRLIMLSLLAMICLGGYAQSKGPEVTLDFSDFDANPWGIPIVPNSYYKDPKTLTYGTYTIILKPGEKKGFRLAKVNGNGVLQMGNKNASITLPAFNFDVEKIVVVPPSGGGNKSVTQNVYVDEVAVSTQTIGCQTKKEYQIKEEYQKSGNRYVIRVTNSNLTHISKIQIYKKQGSGKTATTLSFKDLVGKGVTLINGKLTNGNDFNGYTATEKDNVAGTIAYAASGDGVATVDEKTGAVKVYPNVFGTTTITATFTPTDTEKYAESTASYTVINERTPTTITFGSGVDNNTFEVKDGEIVETRVATVTPVEATGSIVYESSDEAIAKVDAKTGAITLGAKYGTAKITARFDATGSFANSEASYSIKHVGDFVFYESFDKCDGKGGNDGSFNRTGTDNVEYDNTVGWDSKTASGAYKCVKIGSGNSGGYVETPSIAVSTTCRLSFKAASWAGDNSTISVTISSGKLTYNNGEPTQTITIKPNDKEWTDYSMIVSGANPFTVKFACLGKDNRFFLDEVMVTKVAPQEITLDENSDNIVEAAENVNIMLKRTFYKDGEWNTLCLPFAVADAKTAFDGAELREVDTEKSNGNTIVFKEATAIEAGKPYLIKWANSSTEAVDFEKKFEGVTLVAAATPVVVKEGGISFNGFYKMTAASELGGTSVAAIGAGNKLFKVTEGKMKGFRAAFVLSSGAKPSAFQVVIDGTTTGIEDLVIDGVKANGRVYNLNGQYVGNSLNGLQPGLYIQNGKKIVVK